MGKYLTLEEAADRLGVEYKTVYRLVRQGDIPAGKIGRIYRVLEEDIDGYFEQQKQAMATKATAESSVNSSSESTTGKRCCVCTTPIVSELSIAGFCEVTNQPICQACWFVKKARRATSVPDQPAEVAEKTADTSIEEEAEPEATVDEKISQLRSEGKHVITGADAKLDEERFLRSFGQRLANVEQLNDPVSDGPIILRDARSKHQIESHAQINENDNLPSKRVSRFTLRAGGWGKPKRCLTLEARFLSRPDVIKVRGYDFEPINAIELMAALTAIARRAEKVGCFHVSLIASPTGFTDDAVALLSGESTTKTFKDRMAVAGLLDLPAERTVVDQDDPRVRGLLQVLDPQVFEDRIDECCGSLRDILLDKNSVSLGDACDKCNAEEEWMKQAFDRLKRAGEFVVDELDEFGLVISRPRE